jgi:hypothetical protein
LSWLEEWNLGRAAQESTSGMGWEQATAARAPALLASLLECRGRRFDLAFLRGLLENPSAQAFLRVNSFQGELWFHKESLEVLLASARAAAEVEQAVRAGAAPEAPALEGDRALVLSCLTAAAATGYRWDAFWQSL